MSIIETRLAAGYSSYASVPKGHSYSLDAIAKANGMGKTEGIDGAMAPALWQQGRRQEVVDYCKNDVSITRALLKLGQTGELIDPNTGKFLQLASLELRKPKLPLDTQ